MGAFWRGECSLRFLRVLVEHLPAGSAAVRAARGHDWQTADYLLAESVDTLRVQLAAFLRVNGAKVATPKPIPRPGEQAALEERRAETSSAAIAYIERYRAARAQT